MGKTLFDTAKENIQLIIDAINKGEMRSTQDIRDFTGLTDTVINTNIRRIEEIKRGKVLACSCQKAEETIWVTKMSAMIDAVIKNPTLLFWQEKYLCGFFSATPTEIKQLRAFMPEYLKEAEMAK